ncbi:hypothetical protein CAS74_003304 [Pichia kudriavzevii]|uniref:Peroxisomal biogenesis factor 8 n=1 Tax=Pichia kudriavzevii TaxID=4909 RepID=A0A1Z8JKT9_PICKU|nr:hypothetical protein CAS74_003304 [Pichia kudriavzevii]
MSSLDKKFVSNSYRIRLLFHDIEHCNSFETPPDKIISYLVNYYPKLKNKENVELLTKVFLKCPVFFQSFHSVTLNNSSKIVNAFHFILYEKFKITNPTVSFIDFQSSIYTAMLATLQDDPTSYWKILPVLAGCISSVKSMNMYNSTPEYNNVIKKLNHLFCHMFSDLYIHLNITPLPLEISYSYLIILCAAQENMTDAFYRKLLNTNPTLLSVVTSLIFYSTEGLKEGSVLFSPNTYNSLVQKSPVIRNMNRLVFLYGRLCRGMPQTTNSLYQIYMSLGCIVSFCLNISNEELENLLHDTKWDLAKYTFFSIVIVFEHSTAAIISGKHGINKWSSDIATQVLFCFFQLSFILDQIGTGGFDSYNFAFSSATSFLNENDHEAANSLAQSMLNNLPSTKTQLSGNGTSKLNFFLRTVEVLLPSLKESFKKMVLFPLIDRVMFNGAPSKISKLQDIIYPYFGQVLIQFPKVLSLSQTTLIVETCGGVLPPGTSHFKAVLLDLVKFQISMSGYSPLPARSVQQNGKTITIPEKLHTRKSGLVSFLIIMLRFVEVDELILRLNEVKKEIDMLVGERDIYKLYDILWETILVINKFDTQVGQMAISWWYETVNSGQVPKL